LVSYKVVKLWEQDPATVLRLESPGLCPFAPLMAGNPVDLVLKSQERIVAAPEALASAETKRELLTILAGLSAKVIRDRSLIRKLFSEIRLMGENYFFDLIRQEGHALGLVEGRKEGWQEGREEGREEATRRAILHVLSGRLGQVPDDLAHRLEEVTAFQDLESLLKEAVVCPDIPWFLARLGVR